MQALEGLDLFSDWLVATVQTQNRGFEWVCAHLTRENVHYALHEEDAQTLGQLILLKTTCIATMQHLVQKLGVDPTPVIVRMIDRCVMCGYHPSSWDYLFDYCRPKPNPASFTVLDHLGPFAWTPLGRAIYLDQTLTVRFFIEYGCHLPLDQKVPNWAWAIETDTHRRKERCRDAVIALLGVGRLQGCWRDLSRLFVAELWKRRYDPSWTRTTATQ